MDERRSGVGGAQSAINQGLNFVRNGGGVPKGEVPFLRVDGVEVPHGCRSSADCGSGFACTGGFCHKTPNQGSGVPGNSGTGSGVSGGSSGPSSCDDGFGSDASGLNSGLGAFNSGCAGPDNIGGSSPCGDPGGSGPGGGGDGGPPGGGCAGGDSDGNGSSDFGGGGADDDFDFGGFGGAGGCTAPTCGDNSIDDGDGEGGGGGRPGGDGNLVFDNVPDGGCCGSRCCRYYGNGAGGLNVQCFCGPCPPKQRCDKYCSAYADANFGRQAPGCPSSASCDECSECVEWLFWAFCEPKEVGAPCHCGGNNACRQCEICGEDGECTPDCVNCVVNERVLATCDCGAKVDITCQVSPCGGEAAQCQRDLCISRACEKACPQPCRAIETGKTFPVCQGPGRTEDQGYNQGPGCPPGSARQSGFSTIGASNGLTTYCDYCVETTVNEECKCIQPCNCHSDCGDCRLCGPDGCYQDPKCPLTDKSCFKPKPPPPPPPPEPPPEE